MVMWVVGSGGGQSVCVCCCLLIAPIILRWLFVCWWMKWWGLSVCCDCCSSSSMRSYHQLLTGFRAWSWIMEQTSGCDRHVGSIRPASAELCWRFEDLQRRKQLQRPHQTQHSTPPESRATARLPTEPTQGPQSARAGNRPPSQKPTPPFQAHFPWCTESGCSPTPSSSLSNSHSVLSHGEGEHSFCSLASSSTNTPQPPICAEQLIPKKCKKKKNCESAAQGKQFNFHCGVNPEADVEALMFPHIQTASSLLSLRYFSCNALQKWIIINIIISYQSINHSAEPKLHPSRKAGLWCYVCVQLCRCLPATNTKVCELENQRHSSREQEKHRRWLPWLFSLFLTLCSSESKSSTQIACFRHCSLVTVHSYSMQTMSR